MKGLSLFFIVYLQFSKISKKGLKSIFGDVKNKLSRLSSAVSHYIPITHGVFLFFIFFKSLNVKKIILSM
ncbi:hypothetical protein SAMN05216357_104127 [Porphyromonadaceae bacterium KH3CP3RA]|nr:hypothetical protein SAMN05216357_104127 [Porphyromonadaceae bacterium KH3CP3RA]